MRCAVHSSFSLPIAVALGIWTALSACGGLSADDDLTEHVVVFVDCSGSMILPVEPGVTRFQEASKRALRLIDARLQAGAVVHVVPFAQQPLDAMGARYVVTADKPLARLLREAEQYMAARAPVNEESRTAIWDSILQLQDDLARLGRHTTIVVFTDDDKDNTSRKTELDVQGTLRRLWKLPEGQEANITLFVLGKDRPVHFGVAMSPPDHQVPILSAADFAQTGEKALEVPVKCILSASADPKDVVDGVSVIVEKQAESAPDLTVSASLAAPLSEAASEGKVRLKLAAKLPDAAFSFQYTVRLVFSFRPYGQTPQAAPAGRALRIEIASQPTIQLDAAPGDKDVKLLVGQHKDIVIKLIGNADAANKTAKVQALVPEGFSCAFFLKPEEANAPGFWDKKGLDVALGAAGAPVPVTMRIRAERVGTGRIVLSALLAGQTKDLSIAATAMQPTIRPGLAHPNDVTVLTSTEEWKPLACGPLIATHEGGENADPRLTVTVQDSGVDDVEMALDASGAKKLSAPLSELSSKTALRGRLRPSRPGGSLRLPSIRVEVEHGPSDSLRYVVVPSTVELVGKVKPPLPDVWLTAVSPKAAAVSGADRKLSLDTQVCQPGKALEWTVDLNWTTTAIGGSVAVAARAPTGGSLSWEPQGELTKTAAGAIELGKELSGRLMLTATAPADLGACGYECEFRLADGAPYTLLVPVQVKGVECVVDLRRGKEATQSLLMGATLPVATVSFSGIGGPPPPVKVEFSSPEGGIPVRVGWGRELRDVVTAADGDRDVRLYARVDLGSGLAGKTAKGELTFRAASTAGRPPLIRLVNNGKECSGPNCPVEFAIIGWSFQVLCGDSVCDQVPPKPKVGRGGWIEVVKANEAISVADLLERPPRFAIAFDRRPATTMPEEIADLEISVKVIDQSHTLQSAAFVLEGQDKPVRKVKVRDLRRVRDLVLTSEASVARGWWGTKYFKGEIVFEGSGGLLYDKLPVAGRVPWNPWPPLIFLMVAGLLVLAGYTIWELFRRRGPAPAPDPNWFLAEGATELNLAGSMPPPPIERGGGPQTAESAGLDVQPAAPASEASRTISQTGPPPAATNPPSPAGTPLDDLKL